MKWISTQIPLNQTIQQLSAALASNGAAFPLPLTNILVQRGIDTFDKAKYYFVPNIAEMHDPFLMKDMDKATERLLQAKINKEKILVYGDYDVDGTTSVAMMSLFLTDWGFDFEYYIPDRYTEGYGVSFKGMEYAAKIGAKVIVSLDCGIKANEKVTFAKLRGIDFIVCDHHKPGDELPDAYAVLDTLQDDCQYPCKDLSGCGVGLKLIQGLTKVLVNAGFPLPQKDYDPILQFCDLGALSIACDIVPIVGENRIITFFGLKKLRENPGIGLKAIMDLAKGERKWEISDLVFFIGPRVNSAGRLGSAKDAVEVMLGKHEKLALLAEELHDTNHERKSIDTDITAEALELIANDSLYPQKSTTVLYKSDWHKGVIGIVASRLIEKHYRPTILLTESDDKWVGSARSVIGFDLYAALEKCSDFMIQFGGHKYAAGMTVKPENLAAFAAAFDKVVTDTILPTQKEPILFTDHDLPFPEINDRLLRLLQRMEPFGPENPEPVFTAYKVEITDYTILKEAHLRLVLKQHGITFTAIGFGMAEKFRTSNPTFVNIAFHLHQNNWHGKQSIQLMLKDFV